jgi:hypothetical protein
MSQNHVTIEQIFISCVGKDLPMTNDFTTWLLDSPTPSIRYLTLRRLLGRPEDDSDVQATRTAMRKTGPIPAILAKQTAAGHWEGEHSYYTPKYESTHWSMTLLVELAADPDDPHLQRGVDYMLAATDKNYMLEDKFDASVPSPDQYGFTCLWGNILRYIAYCGRADDPRVQRIVDYLVRNLDVGGCRCIINNYLPCAWGVARALWGLAVLPKRSEAVTAAIDKTLTFLLDSGHELSTGAYPTPGKVHKLWEKLNFPLFYHADVLFILRVLGELNALGHPGAQPALKWLESKRQSNGRWRGSSPFGTRTWKLVGDSQDTNRWISLHAAMVMQQAGAQQSALRN